MRSKQQKSKWLALACLAVAFAVPASAKQPQQQGKALPEFSCGNSKDFPASNEEWSTNDKSRAVQEVRCNDQLDVQGPPKGYQGNP